MSKEDREPLGERGENSDFRDTDESQNPGDERGAGLGSERATSVDEPELTISDDPIHRSEAATVKRSDERVRHADPKVRAQLRRRRRRTNRIYLGLGITLVVFLLGYVALYFLPVLSVRAVQVSGESSISAEEIVGRAGVPLGTPLLQVDTHAVARKVAGIPRVNEVTVKRGYPSTLDIVVVERTALVSVEIDGKTHLVDAQGIDFGEGEVPPGTPSLSLGDEARAQLPKVVRDLAVVLKEVRETAGQQVNAIEIPSPSEITVTLADGRKVEWGSPGRDRDKATALSLVLSRPGTVWNVANPALPASR